MTLPEAVWTEVVTEGEGQPGVHAVRTATWVERQSVENQNLVRALRQDLDLGEAEAIALAVETESALLLMDERHGRETASHFDVPHLGLIGVLIDAKENPAHRGDPAALGCVAAGGVLDQRPALPACPEG